MYDFAPTPFDTSRTVTFQWHRYTVSAFIDKLEHKVKELADARYDIYLIDSRDRRAPDFLFSLEDIRSKNPQLKILIYMVAFDFKDEDPRDYTLRAFPAFPPENIWPCGSRYCSPAVAMAKMIALSAYVIGYTSSGTTAEVCRRQHKQFSNLYPGRK